MLKIKSLSKGLIIMQTGKTIKTLIGKTIKTLTGNPNILIKNSKMKGTNRNRITRATKRTTQKGSENVVYVSSRDTIEKIAL